MASLLLVHIMLFFGPNCTIFRTLLIHGLESDWIEEEMADDDDFRLSSSLNSRYLSSCLFLQKGCVGTEIEESY